MPTEKSLGDRNDLRLESTKVKLPATFGNQIGDDEQKIDIAEEVVEQDATVLQNGVDSEKEEGNVSSTTRRRMFANGVKYMHLAFLILGRFLFLL